MIPGLSASFVTVDRPESYLAATLASFGEEQPAALFVGSPSAGYVEECRRGGLRRILVPTAEEYRPIAGLTLHQRASWNLWRALSQRRDGPDLLVFEDDVIFARGWRAYLDAVLREIDDREGCRDFVLTLYEVAASPNADGRRYARVDPSAFFGSQGMLYAGGAIAGFADELYERGVARDVLPMDLLLGHYAAATGLPFFATVPSLVQHIGRVSTGLGYHHRSASFVADLAESDPAAARDAIRAAGSAAVLLAVGDCDRRRVDRLVGELRATGRDVATVALPPLGLGDLGEAVGDGGVEAVLLGHPAVPEGAATALAACWRVLRPGGTLCGDDGWREAARAVLGIADPPRLDGTGLWALVRA